MLWGTCDWIRSSEFLTDTGLLQDGVIGCGFFRNPVYVPHFQSLRIPHLAPALLLRRLAAHTSSAPHKTLQALLSCVLYDFQNEQALNASASWLLARFCWVSCSELFLRAVTERSSRPLV